MQHAIHPKMMETRSSMISRQSSPNGRNTWRICLTRNTPLTPQLPTVPALDVTSSLLEVSDVVNRLKNNKASGPDLIPAEVLKHCDWLSNVAPSPVFSLQRYGFLASFLNNGKRCEYCAHLLSVAGKVLATLYWTTLLTLPTSLCPNLSPACTEREAQLMWYLLPGFCRSAEAASISRLWILRKRSTQ